MLDPISAVGLTASIVQLIMFSDALIRKASSIHRSKIQGQVQHTDLEVVLESFSELLKELEKSQVDPKLETHNDATLKPRSPSQPTALHNLAREAKIVTQDIMTLVQKIKRSTASSHVWSSIREAFLTLVNEDALKELEQRLIRLRSQIDTSLLASLWYVAAV